MNKLLISKTTYLHVKIKGEWTGDPSSVMMTVKGKKILLIKRMEDTR